MKTLVFLFLFSSQAMAATELVHYQISVGGVPAPFENRDAWTQKVAAWLKDSQLAGECVDLKRDYLPEARVVKDQDGVKFKVTGVIRLLVQKDIDREIGNELQTELCAEEGPQCRVEILRETHSLSELSFGVVWRTNSILETKMKQARRGHPFSAMDRFPLFSSSCRTGKTDESFFYAGRSKEAQALIRGTKIDIEKMLRVELWLKDRTFWNFGRPDAWWNERPTTDTRQELAPAEILDLLKND